MAYNPYHMVPPDNPRAEWCHTCMEQIDPDDEDDGVYFDEGIIVHRNAECLEGLARYFEAKLMGVLDKIEKMVERGMS